MKVLLLKDYFYPEQCAGITLSLDLLDSLADSGHEAVVYTPLPSRGMDSLQVAEYRKKKMETRCSGKVVVHRYWLPREGSSVVGRALRYFLQNAIQVIKAFRADYDLLFIGSTPPTMGLVGAICKKLSGRPMVFNVQDVFPDSLVTTGLAKDDGIAWKIGTWVSKVGYNNADKIVTISEGMKKTLLGKGVDSSKVAVIPNWVDTDIVGRVERDDNYLFDELRLSRSGFYVTYAGNIGLAQGCNVIIEAAKMLGSISDITFVVFGGGALASQFQSAIDDAGLSNIVFTSLRPSSEISHVYSMGDVSLITCKAGVGGSGLPSKTISIMACESMPIACFDEDSQLSSLIRTASLGFAVEPENPQMLASAILEAYSNRKETASRGKKCRRYVLDHYSKESCTASYVRLFEEITESR